ncbi:kunitz-type protease inhibitor 1b [Aplochiton taeniatus]
MIVRFKRLIMCVLFLKTVRQVSSQVDCTKNFKMGQENFVIDAEKAVNEGAAFISSPTVTNPKDCMSFCCKDPLCNLALIEKGTEIDSVKTCYLFNCLYRNKYVCSFVDKEGFMNYVLKSAYDTYLEGPEPASALILGGSEPPIANAGRDVVLQPRDEVTLNGIESQAPQDKKITNYEWSLLSGDPAVAMEKTNLDDQVMVSNLQPGVYVFQLEVTDSSHQTATAKVTVLVLSEEQSERSCMVPMKVGPCRGSFHRWHYNAASEKCEVFIYGGCKGNHNNYLSLQECSDACHGLSAFAGRSSKVPTGGEVCDVPCQPDNLICSNGCCLNSDLECDTVEQCSDGSDETSCSKLNQTLSRLLSIDVNQKKAHCTQAPSTGPCRASHTRWYYDPLNTKCHRFTFGGCDGNDNMFDEEKTCADSCNGVTGKHVFARGIFERYEEEETESGAIAVAIILAVAILAVLALLGYCFFKHRKKSTHQPVPTSVPHAPFSENSDTLVYNSTTKPV